MNPGRGLQTIATQLLDEQAKKHDYLAPVQTMVLQSEDTDAALSVGDKRYNLTPLAHQQLAEAADIPIKYYERMRSHSPQLLANNVNHWFKTDDSTKLVRTVGDTARAVLSNRYRPLDNAELIQAIMPSLEPMLTSHDLELASMELTETRLYIKAITPRITGEVKKGDVVQAGVIISNSEVGAGALQISPLLYRLACLNGLIIQDDKMRQVHAGFTGNCNDMKSFEYFRNETRLQSDKAVFMQARDLAVKFLSPEYFQMQLSKLMASALDPITSGNLAKVVEVTGKLFNMPQNETNGVLKHLAAGGDLTKWGLANAVTRVANDLENYDRSTELQQLGGKIIELTQRNWLSIAVAA